MVAMILISTTLLNCEPFSWQYYLRWAANITGAAFVCFLSITIEIIQIWKQKWDYFKDGWNINDLCFFMLYFSAILCDWQLGTV